MRVDLRALQPNPRRDFLIDPIDPEVVERLRQSIAEDGFWGGVVCRRLPDGTLQIGAGHHRVAAALAAGITEADLFVATDMDDTAMIRVYARENATQRGLSSTALTGTVAAAMKFVAKSILTGSDEQLFTSFHLPTLRERLLEDEGVGRKVLLGFLHDIPGINDRSVQHQLANLKASGDYARIIAQVEQEIAAEHANDEVQTLAQQAAQKAAEYPKIFDFQGVAPYLNNAYQMDVFRLEVTSQAVRDYLPLEQQAPLAARIVENAAQTDHHVSGEFIRQEIRTILLQEHGDFHAYIQGERDRLEREDVYYRLERRIELFHKHFGGLKRNGQSIAEQLQEWPDGKEVPPIPYEFRRDLYETVQILTRLAQDRRFAYEPEDTEGTPQPPARRKIPAPRRELAAAVPHR
jgi:Predicted transcriptional regulators